MRYYLLSLISLQSNLQWLTCTAEKCIAKKFQFSAKKSKLVAKCPKKTVPIKFKIVSKKFKK